MTDEVINKEAALIRDFPGWPLFPFLPMKNILRREFGFLVCEHGLQVELVTVYVGKDWPITIRQKPDAQKETYASVEDMIRAGWISD